MPANDFVRDGVAQLIFKQTAFSVPSTLWLALLTAAPVSSGGGTEVTTVGTGYNRMPATTAMWTTNGVGSVINSTLIEYTTAAASTWGTIGWVALVDSSVSSAGVAATTFLMWSALSTNHSINTGDAVRFTSGSLSFAYSS